MKAADIGVCIDTSFANGSVRTALFDRLPVPSVICRSSRAKEPIEWQADFYASCLLMPRKLVFAAWDEMFPDRKQRVIQPRIPIEHRYVEITRLEGFFAGGEFPEKDDLVLEQFAKPFAKKFLVSPVAMRIRLENLGLLHRVVPGQRLLEKLDQLFLGNIRTKMKESFLKRWKSAERKQAIIEELEAEGLPLDVIADELGKNLDPFDLICHVAFGQED